MNGQRWRTVVESACLVLALVAGAVAPTQAQPGPVITEYYHVDAVGSVRVVTNDLGAVVRRYDFAPFGEQDSPCTSSPDARLFTGHERDRETCLDYLGARYYRSTDGRFLTLDPALDASAALVDPQRWNRYAYANNNPLKYVDPDGRNPLLIVGGIAWALYEAGSAIYDVYDAYATVSDPSTSLVEKGVSVAGAAASLAGPGGGYGAGARAAFRNLDFDFVKSLGGASGLVIGRGDDLRRATLREGEFTLGWMSLIRSKPATAAQLESEWLVNKARLDEFIRIGRPIRDVTDQVVDQGFFLNRERDLLRRLGWVYEGGYWRAPNP